MIIRFRFLNIRPIFPLIVVLMWAGMVPTASGASCSDLGELECVTSEICTLEPVSGDKAPYQCRLSTDICEQGFSQIIDLRNDDGSKQSLQQNCQKVPGCEFSPGYCYCPPLENIHCVCGKGRPPACTSE